MITKMFFSKMAVLSFLTLAACKNGEENKETAAEVTAIEAVDEVNIKQKVREYKAGEQVPNELVCMVNNAYMGKPQIPVEVSGKTYYGCCNMCVSTLNEKESARSGIDPVTGGKVDKSNAFIVLLSQKGNVAYFESETTYKKFLENGKY